MSCDISEIQAELEMLQRIFNETVEVITADGRRERDTCEGQIYRRLLSTRGDKSASAFAVLMRDLKEYPPAHAALRRALNLDDEAHGEYPGGIMTVPWLVSIAAVSAILGDKDEKQKLEALYKVGREERERRRLAREARKKAQE